MTKSPAPTALAAKSPFELRVNLGRDVPEADVRSALAPSPSRGPSMKWGSTATGSR
jgi:hypothetical protein